MDQAYIKVLRSSRPYPTFIWLLCKLQDDSPIRANTSAHGRRDGKIVAVPWKAYLAQPIGPGESFHLPLPLHTLDLATSPLFATDNRPPSQQLNPQSSVSTTEPPAPAVADSGSAMAESSGDVPEVGKKVSGEAAARDPAESAADAGAAGKQQAASAAYQGKSAQGSAEEQAMQLTSIVSFSGKSASSAPHTRAIPAPAFAIWHKA